ncbi:MAG: nitrous oxide reductase accessory protein NosL [Salibacteraceae bacterium]
MKNLITLSSILICMVSCKPEPKPIHYNLDVCEFCHMVITDTRYGTEILTQKGKTFKFDSFECLIDYSKENTVEVHSHLVTSFDNPKNLIDGKDAWVIRCKAMPSPMGRYLTVFSKKQKAVEILKDNEGDLLPLEEALNEF